MALKNSAFRCLLAFIVLWSMSVFFSTTLLADDNDEPAPSPSPNLATCNDQNVQHMANGVKALDGIVTVYNAKLKKPGHSAASYAVRYRKTVDLLWNRIPDCSEADKRGDLTREAFVQLMTAMLEEAYDSAVLKLGAGKFHEARFYIDNWYNIHNQAHDEAVGEAWTSWRDLDAELFPRVHALHLRVCTLEVRYCV
jgi:hypothetical protein